MTVKRNESGQEQQSDAAWQRLMSAMENEPVNPVWEKWDRHHPVAKADEAASVANAAAIRALSAGSRLPRRMGGRKRRLAAIAAAALVAITAGISPIGNKALASILGQFRMEQVTEVRGSDLHQLFNSIFEAGASREERDKYGIFRAESGSQAGHLNREDASNAVGFELLPESVTGEQKLYNVSPSSELQMELNVNEINKTMRQLGAEKLLPASVDGKTITLKIGAAVSYHVQENNVYIQQMKAPSLSVDSSADLIDAADAVLQFPLLPQQIRDSLRQSQLLTSGQLPLPVITEGVSERIQVNGTPVIVTEKTFATSTEKRATWVKHGVMTTLNMNLYSGDDNKDAFEKMLQELIGA